MNFRKAIEIFSLNGNETLDDVRKKYLKLSLRLHPDKGGDEEEFKEMCTAYELLTEMCEDNDGRVKPIPASAPRRQPKPAKKKETYDLAELKSGEITQGRLSGQVTRIKAKSDFFHVTNAKGKEYLFYHAGYSENNPLVDGDMISCSCNAYMDTSFAESRGPLMVVLEESERSFMRIMAVSLPSYSGSKATRLYSALKEIVDLSPRHETVHTLLSEIAGEYAKNPSCMYVEMLLTLPFGYDSFIFDSRQDLDRFLKDWTQMYDLRRMTCIGLKKHEIKTCMELYDLTPSEVYLGILENPYKFVNLDITKCHDLHHKVGRKLRSYDIECYKIARFIYMQNIKKQWSCVTHEFLAKRFRSLTSLTERLEKHWDIVYDNLPIYPRDDPVIEQNFENLDFGDEKQLASLPRTAALSPTAFQDKFYYMKKHHTIEKYVCDYLKERLHDDSYIRLNTEIVYEDRLDPDQREAIRTMLTYNVSCLTGAGGTGKTTTTKCFTDNLEANGIDYACCSFTGKATGRIKDVCGLTDDKCSTIHRMIYGSARNIKFDVLIIDEASMLDIELFYKLIIAFPRKFPIVFIGDINQLPPIGWGSLFAGMIESRSIPRAVLKTVHRIKAGTDDGILINTTNIVHHPEGKPYAPIEKPNFHFEDCKLNRVVQIIKDYKARGFLPQDVAVLCPYKRGYNIPDLKKILQKLWNGTRKSCTSGDGRTWYVGDTIRMLLNDYTYNLHNGDETAIDDIIDVDVEDNGTLITHKYLVANFRYNVYLKQGEYVPPSDNPDIEISVHSQEDAGKGKVRFVINKIVRIHVNQDKGDFVYPSGTDFRGGEESVTRSVVLSTKDFDLSHVKTVHSSQGSEYKVAMYYVPHAANMDTGFVNRNLGYVALSRASEEVWAVGSYFNICMSIGKLLPYRCENIVSRLKSLLPRLYDFDVNLPKEEEVAEVDDYDAYDAWDDYF